MSFPRPRNDVRPNVPNLDVLMNMLMGHGDGGANSQGCIETNWSGLPAQRLFVAACMGTTKELQEVLQIDEYASMVNDFDGDGVNVLQCYCFNCGNDPDGVVKALIEAGIDVNAKSISTQETALLYATIYSQWQIIEALFKYGGDKIRVDLSDWRGNTPLMAAQKNCQGPSPTANATKTLQLIEEGLERQKNSGDRLNQANILRQKGNQAFSQKDYAKARELYTQSLEVWEQDHRTFSNRAQCSLKLGMKLLQQETGGCYPHDIRNFGEEAASDANKAIEIEPTFEKAHYRQALGYIMARDFPRAKSHALHSLQQEYCPNSRVLQTLVERLETELHVTMNAFRNPFSNSARQDKKRLEEGAEYFTCGFCLSRIAYPKEADECPYCGMNTETDVTQEKIRDFILTM